MSLLLKLFGIIIIIGIIGTIIEEAPYLFITLVIVFSIFLYFHFTQKSPKQKNSFIENNQAFNEISIKEMTGYDYEIYILNKVRTLNWQAEITSFSGDQGVDIIASYKRIRLAIQCKKNSYGSIGNKAVQEVFTGKAFHNCTHGCVITNSKFTASAQDLATKIDIDLLHHDQLKDHLTYLQRITSY